MALKDRLGFLASLGFTSQSPEEVMDVLSTLGYRGVEWTMAHLHPVTHQAADRKRLSREVDARGMTSSEWVIQQDLVAGDAHVREERIQLVEAAIRVAREAGMDTINLFTGPAPWDPTAPKLGEMISEGDAWSLVFDAFDRWVPLAEKHEVHLAVEAVFGMTCRDFYTLSHLLSRYPSPWLGANLDPSHFVLCRNDIPWTVRALAGRIKHVHLKDAVGVPGMPDREFIFPLLGEGQVPWKAFCAALEEVGYRGILSVEFESFAYYRDVLAGDPVKAAALSMEQIKALLSSETYWEGREPE